MSSTPGKYPYSHGQVKLGLAPASGFGTIQRIGGSPSRTSIRPIGSTLRSQSPTLAKVTTAGSSKRPLSPEPRRTPKASHSRSSSLGGITEGIGNLNRWSQSTVSSKASASTHKRRNSFARRLSGSFGSLAPFGNPQSSPSSKTHLKKTIPSPENSPKKPPQNPALVRNPTRLSPGATLSSLSYAADNAQTPSSDISAAPATADLLGRSDGDYFGDRWHTKSPTRQQTAAERTTRTARLQNSPPRNRDAEGAKSLLTNVVTVPAAPPGNRRESRSASNGHRDQLTRPNHSLDPHGAPKFGGGAEAESSEPSIRSQGERRRRRKEPSQKIMLSKALQKANHAVLLDHAQNFEGAVAAYEDACALLQQVMIRSSGDDDRRKLEAIRSTYANRVSELRSSELLVVNTDDKALPEVPHRPRDSSKSDSNKSLEPFSPPMESEDESLATIETIRSSACSDSSPQPGRQWLHQELPRENIPPRRQSLMPFPSNDDGGSTPRINMVDQLETLDSWSMDSPQESIVEATTGLAPPMEREYMPPPLSPRRPTSPLARSENHLNSSDGPTLPPSDHSRFQHSRQETAESTSWLDTIDESGGSDASSVHSRSSFVGLRRKHIRAASGATEAEFDAALDAAVEAAYDDGLEPDAGSPVDLTQLNLSKPEEQDYISEARRNVEIAKSRVQEIEREALAKKQELQGPPDRIAVRERPDSIDVDFGDEEEERLIEEMTRDYIIYDSEYDMQTKSALPRQSDSSGFSGRTWGSSIGSNANSVGSMPNTAGTSLSTVLESSVPPLKLNQLPSMPELPQARPPPSGALPPPPPMAKPSTDQPGPSRAPSVVTTTPGVRERRLSGQKAKQLKIDTTAKLLAGMAEPQTQPLTTLAHVVSVQAISEPPRSASLMTDLQQNLPTSTLKPLSVGNVRQAPSPFPGVSPSEPGSGISPATPASYKTTLNTSEGQGPWVPNSPSRTVNKSSGPGILKKNFSSSSLRSMKYSGPQLVASDDSPSTPLTRTFSATSHYRNAQLPTVPDLPTPMAATFTAGGLPIGGLQFFDSDIHSPHEPGSPNTAVPNAPLPLEACPESFLLRPFWLLRSIGGAIAHPRGGYISTRLFIPRDVWRVKNVKIKNEDDKVSSCDLITAALLKLSRIDTLDADVVLEEMQSFELVLDQVQSTLAKKLGGEVGLHGATNLFRPSPVMDDNEALSSKSTNTSSKSYLSSWRKLRSKNSSGPGVQHPMNHMMTRDGARDTLTMRTLPMTSRTHRRFPRREVSKVQGIGPHAQYMAALARLCDAVQVLDQIARQAEDPGLRYSSQTHVGLELSMRHAAEFFAFYVCRFVLADIGMMLDKFVKRGSEWILA